MEFNMKKNVLKNSKGLYFTIENSHGNGKFTTTPDLDKAMIYTPDRAAHMAQAYNRDHDDDMQPVPYDKEVLVYYPHVAYHAQNELDAKKYVRKIHLGEADGQFSKAIAVCVQGLWFVHARKDKVFA